MLFAFIYILGVVFCLSIIVMLFHELSREGHRVGTGDYVMAVVASLLSWVMVVIIIITSLLKDPQNDNGPHHVRN